MGSLLSSSSAALLPCSVFVPSVGTNESEENHFIPGDIFVSGIFFENNSRQYAVYHYNSQRRMWSLMLNLPEPLAFYGTVLLFRRLYFTGGERPNRIRSDPRNSMYSYNLMTKKWESVPNLPRKCSRHCACALEDKIYIIGGLGVENQIKASVDCYKTKTKTWNQLAQLNEARIGAGAVASEGHLYIVGGFGVASGKKTELEFLRSVEIYEPSVNRWTMHSFLPVPRSYVAMAASKNKIYACGGVEEQFGKRISSASIDKLDEYSWRNFTSLKTERYGAGVAVIDSKLYVIGGSCVQTDRILSSIECYNLDKKSPVKMLDLPFPGTYITCCIVPTE